jgi:methionyl-tRNA synthetase
LLGLLQRATQGVLPSPCEPPAECLTLHTHTLQLRTRVDQAVHARCLDTALEHIFELIHAANRCIDQTAPWSLIKTGELESASRVLRCLFETLSTISIELAPFLPRTARELTHALRITPEGTLPTAAATLPPSLTLFPRILSDTNTVTCNV